MAKKITFKWRCMCEHNNNAEARKPSHGSNTVCTAKCELCESVTMIKIKPAFHAKKGDVVIEQVMLKQSETLRDALNADKTL